MNDEIEETPTIPQEKPEKICQNYLNSFFSICFCNNSYSSICGKYHEYNLHIS